MKKITLFFSLFFALLLFFSYYLLHSKERVENLNLVENHIADLSLHSKNIDSFLNENVSYINQDIVVHDIQSVEMILHKLSQSNEYKFLNESQSVSKKLDDLVTTYNRLLLKPITINHRHLPRSSVVYQD